MTTKKLCPNCKKPEEGVLVCRRCLTRAVKDHNRLHTRNKRLEKVLISKAEDLQARVHILEIGVPSIKKSLQKRMQALRSQQVEAKKLATWILSFYGKLGDEAFRHMETKDDIMQLAYIVRARPDIGVNDAVQASGSRVGSKGPKSMFPPVSKSPSRVSKQGC
jgi:hypothetical protein